MILHDRVAITTKRKLADGRLVVDARFARAGLYEYAGSEVDPNNEHGLRDKAKVVVYRPPEAVFAADAMASFAHKAITDDHPTEFVNAANWNDLAKGWTGDEVRRDGEFVRVPMMLADADLVDKVDQGKKELSAGYDAALTFGLGFTPQGVRYDALMTGISGNHIAVVDKGRAGAECSIADSEGSHEMPTATKLIHFDGLPIETTDAAEAVIRKLESQVTDLKSSASTLATAHADALAAKDKELGEAAAKIADLESKVLTDEQLDQHVAERAAVLADVAKVAPGLDVKGKPVADARRAAVAKVRGEDAVKDRSDDYVSALFDGLVAAAGGSDGNDPLRSAIGDTIIQPTGDALTGAQAYDAMKKRTADAWKSPSAGTA